jgi:hypothetical protein
MNVYELRPVGLSGGGGGSNSDCRAPLSTHALGLVVMRVVTGPQTFLALPCQCEMAGNPTCLSFVGSHFRKQHVPYVA